MGIYKQAAPGNRRYVDFECRCKCGEEDEPLQKDKCVCMYAKVYVYDTAT